MALMPIDLDDGRRIFAPTGSNPAAVKQQLARKGVMIVVPAGVKMHPGARPHRDQVPTLFG
jgi:hypothetical protein